MKFKVGDPIKIVSGKDKGKTATIARIFPQENKVLVEGVNVYTRHVKPYGERSGEKVRKERPLSVAKIAIVNDKGQVDRVGYQVAKDGSKTRVFKKTGTAIMTEAKKETKKK